MFLFCFVFKAVPLKCMESNSNNQRVKADRLNVFYGLFCMFVSVC